MRKRQTWQLGYLKEILNEIGCAIDIIPAKVESGIPDQPLSEKNTKKGSVNRARAALKKNPNADCGMGIEIGYHKNKYANYEMFCCASILDKESKKMISCFSHRFLLPRFYQEKLKQNLYLRNHVGEFYKKDNHPATKFIAKMVDERKPFIIEAIRSALLRYFKKEEFDKG